VFYTHHFEKQLQIARRAIYTSDSASARKSAPVFCCCAPAMDGGDFEPWSVVTLGEDKNPSVKLMLFSLDWFKGKSTGNHGFYHQI